MNMGVFRIHDRNTLYKIGDLKYNGKYFFKYLYLSVSVVYWKVAQSLSRNYPGGCAQVWGKFGCGPNLPLTDYFQTSCDSSFKMEKKLTMFYIEAHNPLVIKI